MLTDFPLYSLRLISFDYAGIHFNVKIDDFIVTIIRQMSSNLIHRLAQILGLI